MSGKANRKKEKKRICPPLTFIDKSIYFLCIVFSVLGMFFLSFLFEYIKCVIAFSKPDTVAFESGGSNLFFIPFTLFLFLSAFSLFISGWESKKPIFGSKKYKYGEYPFRKDCFPLFSQKKYHVGNWKKKYVRWIIILWYVSFIALSCLVPFGLFGREALYEDNSIEKISLINTVSAKYTTKDFLNLTIQSQYYSGYRTNDRWVYEIIIEMKDGKDFRFSNENFMNVSNEKDTSLDKMLEIKSLFDPEAITVNGAENIDEISNSFDFNEQQKSKLKELFA